jgi:hypothetical protein
VIVLTVAQQPVDVAGIRGNVPRAMMRAINWTGDKARTQVARALARQAGVKYSKARALLRTTLALPTRLIYRLDAREGYLSLLDFTARATGSGVSAAPWGQRRIFRGSFLVTGKGGGRFVAIRKGAARLPLKKLWGPALPNEAVRGASRLAFETTVSSAFPARLEHELARPLGGRKRP